VKIECAKDSWLFVVGEVTIEVLNGSIEIFGADYKTGSVISVPKYRSAPVRVLENALLNIDFEDGYIAESKESLIPREWRELGEKLLNRGNGYTVMTIGNVDTGKTGLLTFLANYLLKSGKKVAVIDADVGQSDIGPPTTIGLGLVEKPIIHLSEIPLQDAFFVGSVTPAGVLNRSIIGTYRMVQRAKELGVDVILIDTTGWVGDRWGRELKIGKISVVQPDLIVFIEKDAGELSYLEKSLIGYSGEIYKVPAAPRLRVRNWEERRELRKMMYLKEFTDAREVVIDLNDVNVSYGFLGTGRSPTEETLNLLMELLGDIQDIYIEESWDSILIITENKPAPKVLEELKRRLNKREIFAVTPDNVRNLLISLHDRAGKFLGLGIILDFNPREKKLLVFTRARLDAVTSIQFGHMKLSIDGEELEKFAPWFI